MILDITNTSNEKIYDSEMVSVMITDFWDFEDDNGVAISGPYGLDISIKGFTSPKNPVIDNVRCISKSFNKFEDTLAYSFVRLRTFKRSLEKHLKFFKKLLIEEEYKGVKDSSSDPEFIYKFTDWAPCTKASICNLKKYDDEMNCRFTPYITFDGASFRANGNTDYSEKEKKLRGVRDWFFLIKDYTNNCEQAIRNMVDFLETAIEDLEPVFDWLSNLFDERENLNTGKIDKKIISKETSYVPNPISNDFNPPKINQKDEWSDENTVYNDEAFEDDNIPF